MPRPFLTIQRFPYEEPYHTHIQLTASNGSFGGSVDFYCNVDDFGQIGTALANFPARVGDEYVYERGSEDPADRCYRYVRLRAYTVGRRGDCALQLSMNLNGSEPGEGICRFSIPVEAAALNRLGNLLVRFGELRHLELQWTPAPDGDGLFEEHQRPPR
jgi:hypothetical protein